ncbi:hypothetical protein IE81DRAFT_327439 [Ceraceosorus guamensis]|uniref:Uncharacterized protein n=1 Tax=Ceraceosorus guamensis TaxID=1522189 RepID=A0A316W8Z9_9BASI|nr:hypothetical protein IE81DRAFT_327439 [Ceraceosorus guamensis]PWN46400.1 hypothetical protein IE81DRAFT_327439 [Ceraceosorus guamensis]
MRFSAAFAALVIFVAVATSAFAEPTSEVDSLKVKVVRRAPSIRVESDKAAIDEPRSQSDGFSASPLGLARHQPHSESGSSAKSRPRLRLSKRAQAKLNKRTKAAAATANAAPIGKRASQSGPEVVTVLVARNVPMGLIHQALKMNMERREDAPSFVGDGGESSIERRELSMLDPRCFGMSDKDVLRHPYEDRKYIRTQIRASEKAAKKVVKAASWKSEAHMTEDRRPSNRSLLSQLFRYFSPHKRSLEEEEEHQRSQHLSKRELCRRDDPTSMLDPRCGYDSDTDSDDGRRIRKVGKSTPSIRKAWDSVNAGANYFHLGQIRRPHLGGIWNKLTRYFKIHRRGLDKRGEEQHELFLRDFCRRDILRVSMERRQARELERRQVGSAPGGDAA